MKQTFQNISLDFTKNKPKRIISLVPSITQYLYDLDLKDNLVGITLFCEKRHDCERIGGTKKVDIEKIKRLQPDLILANKEENVKVQIEELALYFPLWLSDVNTLEESYEMMLEIGKLVHETENAQKMVAEIKVRFHDNLANFKNIQKPKIAYFIWKDPLMVAANYTFINSLIHEAGFENIFEDQERYPAVSVEEIKAKKPEILFLSSEPFPFSEKHQIEFKNLFPSSKIVLCDGKMFSWYGSQLLESPAYFQQLHQEIGAL